VFAVSSEPGFTAVTDAAATVPTAETNCQEGKPESDEDDAPKQETVGDFEATTGCISEQTGAGHSGLQS
jgi:hypothetical protein